MGLQVVSASAGLSISCQRCSRSDTERERYVLEQNLPVYRVLYRRNQNPRPSVSDLEQRWQEIDNPVEALTT